MAQTINRTRKVQIRATIIVANSRSTQKVVKFIKECQDSGDIAFINDIKLFGSEEFDALQALGCLNALKVTTHNADDEKSDANETVSDEDGDQEVTDDTQHA